MRITFVMPSIGLEGGARVVAMYADLLRRRGHSIHVVGLPRRPPKLERRIKNALRKLVGLKPVGSFRKETHFDHVDVPLKILPRYRPVLADDVPDADVVVATWWETARWVAAFPERKGKQVWFIQHDERVLNQPADEVAAVWRLPMARIVVAQWLAEVGREEFGVETRLAPNAVDASLFTAPPRERNDVEGRPLTVGLMYAREPFKGTSFSLKAFELARQQIPGLRLICFGSQEEDPHRVPLPEGVSVEVRPTQKRIAEIYASCDAWLFGSRSEGFGLPILEAMACRTPVIATPAGAAPELVGAGGGLLIDLNDPASMAAGIVDLLTGPAEAWKRKSDNALAIAQAHDWQEAVVRFESLLRAAKDGQPVR